jgi:hypothetical protein
MNSDLPHDPRTAAWEQAAVARRSALSRPPGGEDGAPFGFATRVVSAWQELRRNERAALWAKWSLRAAFCSMTVAAAVILLQQGSPGPAGEILPVPAYEMP